MDCAPQFNNFWSLGSCQSKLSIYDNRITDMKVRKNYTGSALSGALVSTLVGLAASNLGLVPSEDPVYGILNSYLLPLAVPLMLYAADMKRVFTSTGKLLVAFSVSCNYCGHHSGNGCVPLRSLGSDDWKIAAALMSRHIGGGKFRGFEEKQRLLASNANIGGPTTAAGRATRKGCTSLVILGIFASIFGIAIATFLSIALGIALLQKL